MTKDEVTYEQPHGWMQQLVSETDGKKTIRYTFTKTRIGKNDIPIYFEEALEQPAQEARLVSYAPDKSTCTLNIDGEEVYFNREQPAQEPVAWISESTLKHSVEYRNRFDDAKSWAEIRAIDRKTTNCDVPLYTHPAPSWQGLSDDEILEKAAQIMVEKHYKEKNQRG